MKALDTPVLLALLHGRPSVRRLLAGLKEEELATTEANLIELLILARRAGNASAKRVGAIERLRRRMTVLPIDGGAVSRLASSPRAGELHEPPTVLAMLGALEAAGCGELLTSREFSPHLRVSFHIRQISID